MKVVKILSLVIVALFISTAIWAPIAAAQDIEPKGGSDIRADAKGAEVRMFFRGSVVTPTRPTGNSSAEMKTCQGKAYGARMFGVPVATWKATVNGDVTASGPASVVLWARSQAGAKNAGFRINLMRSGGNTQSLFTNRQTLAAQPVKFTATGTYNQQFNTGDTFDVQLIWLSDPKHGVGPAGSGEFLYGNAEFDSSVKVAFQSHPISILNISAPVVSSTQTTIKADFKDILGADPSTMAYNIAITGATTANSVNIGEPSASGGTGNSSSVSWVWKSGNKGDNARSGQYQVMVGISYDGNSTAQNTSMLNIVFPAGKSGGGGGGILDLKGGNLTTILTLVIVLVVVIVVVAVVAVMRSRKGKSKKKRYEEEDEEEEEEEEEDEDEDDEDEDEEEDEN